MKITQDQILQLQTLLAKMLEPEPEQPAPPALQLSLQAKPVVKYISETDEMAEKGMVARKNGPGKRLWVTSLDRAVTGPALLSLIKELHAAMPLSAPIDVVELAKKLGKYNVDDLYRFRNNLALLHSQHSLVIYNRVRKTVRWR